MQPLVSIITVCYNAEALISATVKSVLSQDYERIEYIIIDGASTDGTLRLVNEYNDGSFVIVSENDKGLYDAMNKGQALAKGEFVYFLNAGDVLYAVDVVSTCMKRLLAVNADIVYGDTMLVNDRGDELGLRSKLTPKKLPQQLSLRDMRHGMVVCHQAVFVRKAMAGKYLLDNIAGDIDWLIQALEVGAQTVNAHVVVAKYLIGGISKQREQQSWIDRCSVLYRHFGLLKTIIAHLQIIVKAISFRIGL